MGRGLWRLIWRSTNHSNLRWNNPLRKVTVLGVFVMRVKEPHAKMPFKTWGFPVTPVIFLLLNGWMLCYLVIERPLPSLGGLMTVACGLLFYRVFATRQFAKIES